MDCLPLSEGTFRKAVMGDSGGDKIKFNTELSAQEVSNSFQIFGICGRCCIVSNFPGTYLSLSFIHIKWLWLASTPSKLFVGCMSS